MKEFKEYICFKYKINEHDFNILFYIIKKNTSLLFHSLICMKNNNRVIDDIFYYIKFKENVVYIYDKMKRGEGENFYYEIQFSYKDFIKFICDFIKSYYAFIYGIEKKKEEDKVKEDYQLDYGAEVFLDNKYNYIDINDMFNSIRNKGLNDLNYYRNYYIELSVFRDYNYLNLFYKNINLLIK